VRYEYCWIFNESLAHENDICWLDEYLKKQEVYWIETFRKTMISWQVSWSHLYELSSQSKEIDAKSANQLGIVRQYNWMLKKYQCFTACKLQLLHELQVGDKPKRPNFAAHIPHELAV
jgi:hypothetical protein